MTKVVVIIGFVLSFAAGLIVGLETKQTSVASPASPPTTNPSHGHGGPGQLAVELNLTPDQQEKMKTIWSDVAKHGRGENEDRRRQLRSERDDAVTALIPAADKEKFEQIKKNYSDQMAAMDKEMHARFDEAVKKTREILTAEQRSKYDEILARHQFDRGRGGPGGPGGGGGPGGPERNRDSTTRGKAASSQP
jgi:Spy/CpxP family protein refolding chaperone